MREFYDLHVHLSELNYKKAESALDVISYIGVTRAALQSLTYRSAAYNLGLLHVKNTYKRMELSVFGMVHNVPNRLTAKCHFAGHRILVYIFDIHILPNKR